ncbi:MAG TPA: phytanoyl-CoA dioxygenase family protein [Candidatus Binataceae bacterium]|nr:phytanoyl-CoA dioxygenase family protein [Candidatus Binataceae bacterium]
MAKPPQAPTAEQQREWNERGFFIIRNFEDSEICSKMLARVIEISRLAAAGKSVPNVLVTPEMKPNELARNPEDRVSKIFRLHRDPLFKEFCERADLLDLVAGLIGPELDCFLSQFIFKNHGAMGQPWHQDSFYFPFSTDPQVGIWLAITRATLENGCLHVLPGSHREPVHAHCADQRPNANYGYLEILDHDMSAEIPVLMEPGDLLIFHSHLMHKSTDNVSDGVRAAMVWHYTPAGTIDHSQEKFGVPAIVNDFMPVRRVAA